METVKEKLNYIGLASPKHISIFFGISRALASKFKDGTRTPSELIMYKINSMIKINHYVVFTGDNYKIIKGEEV